MDFDQLFEGLAAGSVSDQQAQFADGIQLFGDGFEPAEEEKAHREVGSFRLRQERTHRIGEERFAFVKDVVRDEGLA